MEALRIKFFYTTLSWIVLLVVSVFQFFGENIFRVLHSYMEIPITAVCCIVSTVLSVRTCMMLFHPLFRYNFWRLAFKMTCLLTIMASNIKFPIFYFEWISSALYVAIDIKSDQMWLLYETLTQTFQLWFCLDCYVDLERIKFECLERNVTIRSFGSFGIDLGYITKEKIDELVAIQNRMFIQQQKELTNE